MAVKQSKKNFLRLAAICLSMLAAITVWVGAAQTQQKPVIPENYFPDGEGRDIIFQTCVQCHDLRNTVAQRKSAAAWKRTVDEMIWRGAPLMVEEADIVSKYLTASFGPDKPIPDELKAKPTSNER